MPTNKNIPLLMGAIAGDVIGSIYEHDNIKSTEFTLFSDDCDFTDDTVLTIALADCILNNKQIAKTFQEYGRKYPHAGFGGKFIDWIFLENPEPYNSWGNGSAMRVTSIGYAFDTEEDVLKQAKISADVTHNHIEGVKGAQATAMCIFLARKGKTKEEILNYISTKFNYDLSKSIDEIRPDYKFDVSCQGSVPQAIRAFLDSKNYENAIRLAISIGGDSDTIACITGAIAQAFYKDIPLFIIEQTMKYLPNDFIKIIADFDTRYNNS